MMTGADDGGVRYIFTSVPQMPATSIFSNALSLGMSGMGNSRISVLLGPARTAATTFSIDCLPPSRNVPEYITTQRNMDRVTIQALHEMKRNDQKIVAIVAWDFQIAQIADRLGVEIISVGDSVGVNLWGHSDPSEITLEEMITVCKAVRRGTNRAVVSCDVPVNVDDAVQAAMRLVKEAGADIVKLDQAAESPEVVTAIVRQGITVFAQFEAKHQDVDKCVIDGTRLEAAGASLLDFKRSGPVAGPAVVRAVKIPVLGGMGGGPWLDGRIRMAHAAIGYAAGAMESQADSYANVARITMGALGAYAEDVRAGRQIKGM